ncbi:hypothetical protein E1B28_000651 [Marasmius oreades]|uniref:Uncharacterized protein n=1 Tax=Marasmius oreades TaxID=181124 RepID=A0A9P8AEC8_9AGAR|nr:uncharacterized protein E1B28_000651 [Marasmius oreades]KAG7098741.1 hypothetical protein E1B28_000651 [Marasmius oreades]
MSVESHRLNHPRPRHPPPPLRLEPSSVRTSSSFTPQSPTLLYDLPSATSLSPPNSPSPPPTSPGRSRRNGHRTPPLGGRNRSQTRSDLEKFSEYCRLWYFHQDEEAGRLMTQTMANLPPSQRAPFSRLQSSMRSTYHRSVNVRRTAEFNAHLSATQPGASLTPHARLDINGPAAKKERYERFERFLRSWCTMGMPGPQPFFQSLWAIMRLQVLPENVGGAGRNRIEWQFDDAVFKEAAGKDFMLEAIDVLKGVLGFEEIPFSRRISTLTGGDPYPDLHSIHSRSTSQPLLKGEHATTVIHSKRARAPSDPFIDRPAHSRPLGSPHPPMLISATSDSSDEPLTSIQEVATFDDEEEEYLRIWTTPLDIINSEYISLIKLFPPHVTRRPLPYFPTTPPSRPLDIEEGDDDDQQQLRIGTGTIKISRKQRSDGWQGGWWSRFLMWWRGIFC